MTNQQPPHRPATIVVDGAPYALAVHDAEGGGFWTEVAGLPGCLTQGDTLADLNANAQDAIRCWLEEE